MIVLTLWPLAQTEIRHTKTCFLDRVFAEKWQPFECLEWNRAAMIDTLLKGGFPPIHDASSKWRSEWCNSYLTTILERDVQDITQVRRVEDLFLLMNLLATRSAQLLNIADIGRSSGIPYATLTNYLSLLESLFFIVRIPAWHANLTKRLTKMAKLYVADTALLSYLVEASATSLEKETTLLGHILESFVAIELKKLMSWYHKRLNLFHFRTESGTEVDLLLQEAGGHIVGIEVKLNSTIRPDDFKGLEYLAAELKSKFLRGIVLYPGKDIIAFGKNMIALPLSSLWTA